MSGKTRHLQGWVLVHTVRGWYAVRGSERIRVGSSFEEHTESLDERFRKKVQARDEAVPRA